MKPQTKGAAKRLLISLMLASGLGGCAVYGPPYAAYDTSYSYPYSSSYSYPYYAYGSPGYVYPPVTLGFNYSYIDRGYSHRGHGYRGWGHGGGHRGGWGRRR